MQTGQHFVDYYEVLNVSPNCSAKALENAYRSLAKMYHPDHVETADVEKLGEVIAAYRVLKDPAKRAKYDLAHASNKPKSFRFSLNNDFQIDEASAISDAEIHEKILLCLYKRRREQASDAGVIGYFIQEMLGCSDQQFEFHTWYLKSKGFIEGTEQGTLVITIQGVDHVISTCQTKHSDKLLIDQSHRSHETATQTGVE